MATKTIVFSPFARLEGDLQVKVDVEEGRVVRAYASGTLYRGFEALLRGRDPLDAIVITPRVCGQCGLAHSAASAGAIRSLLGTQMPPNAYVATNVMLAIELVLSHLAHFYLSFAPDLAEPPYDDEATRRFLPLRGSSFLGALRAREEILGVLGLFAGKWPNTLAIQPGGTTRPLDASEIRRARGLLGEFTEFVRQQVIGCEPDEWLALRSASDLDAWLGEGAHAASDVGAFATFSLKQGLDRLGKWPARFMSSGGWPRATGETLMKPGACEADGDAAEFCPGKMLEHVKHSWYDPSEGGVHPFDGEGEPAPDRADAYSWAKAPRYAGAPAEAGPLARMVNDGDPLVVGLLRRHGPSAFVREMARLHETLRLLRQIGIWLNEVAPEEPFYRETPRVESGSGVAVVEAPRGTLGHWLRAEGGKIRNYQIITPTGWNLSPRDSEDRPGPLEMALVGTPVPDLARPVAISHVVKSFDPCLFCTVH
ncbi:MAG: HupV protein [Planctomycetes bacterium]|nr:HupV protein [Planctomycetota bacterium]